MDGQFTPHKLWKWNLVRSSTWSLSKKYLRCSQSPGLGSHTNYPFSLRLWMRMGNNSTRLFSMKKRISAWSLFMGIDDSTTVHENDLVQLRWNVGYGGLIVYSDFRICIWQTSKIHISSELLRASIHVECLPLAQINVVLRRPVALKGHLKVLSDCSILDRSRSPHFEAGTG